MIIIQRLAHYVGAEPFRPFRIRMASGQTLEIRHPELISFSRSTATIYTMDDTNSDNGKDRQQEISLLLIESVEPIEAVMPKAN
jgi:hypothetical protein